eukprot:TRINITY_DN91747_c0_g1_i1.p1 TRINITY_DN91747_c0_g1~~TRINITY_DN91747_c0_g1_i1.p1  ORF type:complete len:681 (-),score=149.69 TRINITY_DN91747_c0_g1_i1:182-2161(-)
MGGALSNDDVWCAPTKTQEVKRRYAGAQGHEEWREQKAGEEVCNEAPFLAASQRAEAGLVGVGKLDEKAVAVAGGAQQKESEPSSKRQLCGSRRPGSLTSDVSSLGSLATSSMSLCCYPVVARDGELVEMGAGKAEDSDGILNGLTRPFRVQQRGVDVEMALPLDAAAAAAAKSAAGPVTDLSPGDADDIPLKQDAGGSRSSSRWSILRPLLFGILMVSVVGMSAFFEGLLGENAVELGEPSLTSLLRYGTIPIIAAIIGYGTNVAALEMMFLPLEFVGLFPWLKIPFGLDLPLCGWQGVIPMKRTEMASLSVDMMTEHLLKVEEIFSRLDATCVANEMADVLPDVISTVLKDAAKKHCPKAWEHLPIKLRTQLQHDAVEGARGMIAELFRDLQRKIRDVFDLKDCIVQRMEDHPEFLNEMFRTCGDKEFEVIRISGFYLGFLFGILQMVAWMFIKLWWILPVCGVFVGYFTNVIALKVIFNPIEPTKIGCWTVQGLFMLRQKEVSATYGSMAAKRMLPADALLDAFAKGKRSEAMFKLVEKHMTDFMEEQVASMKPLILLTLGAETWADFRQGVCDEFREHLPALFSKLVPYTQRTLGLEETLRTRLSKLPAKNFEWLLHSVFQQDEIKLILVGAILGALVGFLQAVAQTPEQLGIEF